MASNSAPPLPIGPLQGLLYRFATPAPHQAALSLTGNLRAATILNTLLENAAPPRLKTVAPLVRLHSVHTLYSMTYATHSGVNLRAIALAPEQIHTTASILRAHDVAVFTYPAADPLDAPNIGVLNHHAVENSETRYVGTWVCEVSTRGTQVERHTLPTP